MPRTLQFTKFHPYSYLCLLTLKAGTFLWVQSGSQYAQYSFLKKKKTQEKPAIKSCQQDKRKYRPELLWVSS